MSCILLQLQYKGCWACLLFFWHVTRGAEEEGRPRARPQAPAFPRSFHVLPRRAVRSLLLRQAPRTNI